MFSPPLEIVTDNGPQYVGQPFLDMCKKWNIQHTTTSPRYAQSNGLIERQVRAVKGIIPKCAKTGSDVLIALQHHRCTPLDSHLSSPSEILFNRPVRTTLPSHHPTLTQSQQLTNEQFEQRRANDKGPRSTRRPRACPAACWSTSANPEQGNPPVMPWRDHHTLRSTTFVYRTNAERHAPAHNKVSPERARVSTDALANITCAACCETIRDVPSRRQHARPADVGACHNGWRNHHREHTAVRTNGQTIRTRDPETVQIRRMISNSNGLSYTLE